jgi:glyoxylase-like metal-dependent hydrolase (beta-lactamase superfamily II)
VSALGGGAGIMIDPPPNSAIIHGIPPSLIEAVIVTHCHADHDAGAFQKILQVRVWRWHARLRWGRARACVRARADRRRLMRPWRRVIAWSCVRRRAA